MRKMRFCQQAIRRFYMHLSNQIKGKPQVYMQPTLANVIRFLALQPDNKLT